MKEIKILKNRKVASSMLLLALLAVGTAKAQNDVNMPYSQYGVGFSNLPYSMPFAASLGGAVYTLTGSNYINPFNPASYASIQKESFVFDMGLGIDMSTLKDRNSSLYDSDGNIGHITFGLPITGWWKTSIGLMAYSDVNYESVQVVNDPLYGGDVKTRYDGVGGVSQLYWGHAFNVIPDRLSVGFNANLLVGSISRGITYDFQGNDSTYWMNSCRYKSTTLRNLTFDFGAQYFQPLGEKYSLGIGLTVKTPRTMAVKEKALTYTYVTHAGAQYIRDTIFPLPGQSSEFTSTLEQPLVIGFGLSLACKSQWMVAADVTFAPWNGLKYIANDTITTMGNSALQYDQKWSRYALGVERSGDKDDSRYLRRISWRAGVSYEQGCLPLRFSNAEQYGINEFGVGIGASLPMRKGRSLVNLSLRYSRLGNVELLQRNCVTFGISLGSCESWFVKRKYN